MLFCASSSVIGCPFEEVQGQETVSTLCTQPNGGFATLFRQSSRKSGADTEHFTTRFMLHPPFESVRLIVSDFPFGVAEKVSPYLASPPQFFLLTTLGHVRLR